jgi:tRNA1Val (adenine37-N6)-methyltransferase
VELNELEDRIELHLGDIRKIGSIFKPHSCDAVFFNPPYRKLNSGRVNPHHEKAVARHEVEGALNDFIRAGKYLLKSSGAMYAIYPATRGVNLIVQMKKSGIEPKRLRMVHSDKISEAEFIIVEGIKGGREELKVMPPLFIYEDTNEYSCEMKKILKEITDPHLSFC